MKFTLDQIKAIIAEEVANVTKEAYEDDDPNRRLGYANKGRYEDPEDRQRRWLDKADLPPTGGSGGSEEDEDDKKADAKISTPNIKAKAIRDFLRIVLEDPDYTWADYDNEHHKVLYGVLKNRKDENREEFKRVADANGLDWKYLLVDLDWIVRGYGLPKSFKGLEDALKAQEQ